MYKPILFNTEMVKAIIDGRKTATRRLIQPRYRDNESGYSVCRRSTDNSISCITYTDEEGASTRDMKPPYNVDDILYVRETWAKIPGASSEGGYAYKYKASDEGEYWSGVKGFKWKPSIHMPKEAARIYLRVTEIRIEKLQDISEEDAVKEGLYVGWHREDNSSRAESARQAFMWIWQSVTKNAQEVSWLANPWVWAIYFERYGRSGEG